jgi:EmrB/QacA subfamily drug resistance transporter
MTSLDNTVVNVALPSIQRDLRLSLAGLEWVVSTYILVFATLLLAGGRLADLYGQRRLFLIGLSLFTGASLLAGLAGSQSVLLLARALQGIGAALATPTTLAIIAVTFPDDRARNLAVAAWSATAALALALGPFTGGFISQHWHWTWIFLINIPLGALTLGAGALTISEPPKTVGNRSLDLPGSATSALALFALSYALIEGHEAGFTSPVILAALGLAGLFGAAFVLVESRSRAPMIDLQLFRSRIFAGGIITLVLWGLAVLGVYFFSALYLQTVLGLSPTQAGLAFVPMALLMAAFAPLAAKLSDRAGTNRTVATGMGLVAVGLLATSLVGDHATFGDLMVPFTLIGIGSGLTMPLTSNVLGVLPHNRAGVASGVLNAAREVAALLGVTVIGAILTLGQSAALADGATPTGAFAHGYTTSLVVAALLVTVGAATSFVLLDGRVPLQPDSARPASPRSTSSRRNTDVSDPSGGDYATLGECTWTATHPSTTESSVTAPPDRSTLTSSMYTAARTS